MAERFCCPECFGDRVLRDEIFPTLEPKEGICDFCGTTNTLLVAPAKLADYFELLVNVYEPSLEGKTLVEWMKDDWLIFSHERMDNAHAKELLSEILNDGEIVRRTFQPSSSYSSHGLAQWDRLRDEIMYSNRWFLDVTIDEERLKELLEMLIVKELPNRWHRARIQSEDGAFQIDKMGAPPKKRSSNGRANPAGIPYLYLGSLPKTAVAEVRPHTGEVACVATFDIPEIKAVDLRNPRELVSPFILEDAKQISQLRADLPFLERLGEELTRPVQPSGAAIDYIPSQYLCEFIKKKGFDGVVYRSSVSEGINLALFNPGLAVGGDVTLFIVSKVSVAVGAA
ncbi:RES family NAD+ phosphorylase [Neptunomonas phycophila]|uniref:RES family NAD+ phosphorylase n=1 Tax=Neptunomonas phycophila TaxID=1572645 RepID=UPI001BE798EE|nr:RES family NAD+ phosphorylase [Neptunomonas phycophila]MBT3144180.1 RES family NAD+ phosphorylase [Neptunomonas phycophila]